MSPSTSLNGRRVWTAIALVIAVATSSVIAQFGTFNPAFEGELWGVRHALTLPNNGVPAGVVFVNGTLYVVDLEHDTLIAYDSNGNVVAKPGAQWDASDVASPVAGMSLYQLSTATVRRNGTDLAAILVSDEASNRVAAFDEAGAHLFTLRLTRPHPDPTLSLSINQMAMAPGSRFDLTTNVVPALSTLSLTGTFAAGWVEQELIGTVNSGMLAYKDNPAFVNVAGLEFEVGATAVLTGTESDPVAPEPVNMFGVAFDTAGNLYALDAITERLNVYAPDLTHLFTYGTPVADGTTAEFHEAWGLAFWPDPVGTGGRLVASDTYKSRLLVLRPTDGADADAVIDSLQFETHISNLPLNLDELGGFSLAVDPAQNLIAVTDWASRLFILGTSSLTAFDVQFLDDQNAPIDGVCTAADYRVRFSLTVASGFAPVTGVAPVLVVDGVPDGQNPLPADVYPSSTLAPGDVVTYTYSLTAPAVAGADIAFVAGATATNTSDIRSRAVHLHVSDCAGETDPSTLTATPLRAPQVSGWTPFFAGETFSVALHAQDDDGIETIAYTLEGANESGAEPIETAYDGQVTTADQVVEIPDPGRTTLRYRMRDGNGIWSTWQVLALRTKLVVDRMTNENAPAEFRVGDPEGVGFVYGVNRVPDGITFSAETGQFAGIPSFDAHQPYSNDPEVASGVYHVVVTETAPGGATSDVAFTWTINHINREPIITTDPVGFSVNQGEYFELDIDGFDPDSDPSFWTVNGHGVNIVNQVLPPTITIDPVTGLISGTFPPGSDTEWIISVGLSECAVPGAPPCDTPLLPGEHLATLKGFAASVNDLNDPADVVNPGPQLNAENDSVTLQIAASDPEGDTLHFLAGGLPPGLGIDADTGLISGTVAYSSAGNYAVTVEVDDGVNNPRAVTFAWTITATNRPPALSIPDRTSLEGETITSPLAGFTSDPDGDALTFVSATGLPPGLTMNAAGLVTGSLDYNAAGTYPVAVTVSDGQSQTTATFTWTVFHVNRYPVLNPVNQVNIEGDTAVYTPAASDPDGDPLTFTINGLPVGLSMDGATGLISGSLGYNTAGTYTVNVAVSDGALAVVKTFTWTVTNFNRPPAVTAIADRLNAENDSVSLQVLATDPDGDPNLTYSASNLPPGLSINPATGQITGTLTYDASGSYAVSVTVADSNNPAGQTTVTFTWTVTNVNRPPTITAPPRVNAEHDTVSYATAASDPDGTPLTYSATGLPPGASINPATGEISGTLGYDSAGVHTVTITVSDGALSASADFVWTISETNAPPVLANPGDLTNSEGEIIARQFTATDEDGTPLTFSAAGLPPGLSIDASGLVTGTLPYTAAGVYPVTLTVSDGQATRSVTFTWTVLNVNRPPDVINPGAQTSNEGAIVTLPISASDPDGQAVTFSATGLPPGLSIDPLTGVISGAVPYTAAGTYTVTVTAVDGAGAGALSDSETFTWTIENTNRPPVAAADVASVIQGQSVVITVRSNDSDPDADALTVTSVSSPSTGTAVISGGGATVTYTAPPAFVGTATFNYTISDGHGGTATATVTVTVNPSNVPPVCTAAAPSPGVLWPANHKPVYFTIGGVTDPDGGAPAITITSILQDEPTQTRGDGNTTQDAGIENNGATAWVRAERMGGESANVYGRVYIINFTATDAQGASCTGTAYLGVPHDRGNHDTPIPSSGRWNSITGALVVAPAPVANDDAISLKKGTSQVVSVQANDVTSGSVAVTIAAAPSQGSVTVNPAGTITYAAPANWTGSTRSPIA